MTTADYPKESELRKALTQRAERFCVLTHTSLSALGTKIKRDKCLFRDIQTGRRNFTIGLYTELMAFFDENWPKNDDVQSKKQVM